MANDTKGCGTRLLLLWNQSVSFESVFFSLFIQSAYFILRFATMTLHCCGWASSCMAVLGHAGGRGAETAPRQGQLQWLSVGRREGVALQLLPLWWKVALPTLPAVQARLSTPRSFESLHSAAVCLV
jgi:hypothetical protein